MREKKIRSLICFLTIFFLGNFVQAVEKSKLRIELKYDERISVEKSNKIAFSYLAKDSILNSKYFSLQLGVCEKKDILECESNKLHSEKYGEFCTCDFFIIRSFKDGCYSSSKVKESCTTEDSCEFKFSDFGVGGCD